MVRGRNIFRADERKEVEQIMMDSILGLRIREARKKAGLSQEGLARKLGVAFATVNRWENGKPPRGLYRKTIERWLSGQAGKKNF